MNRLPLLFPGALLALVLAAGCAPLAQVPPSEVAALPISAVLRRTLPNGMEVLLDPEQSHPVAALQLWIRAGSIYEEGKLGSGVSHYLEHLAFKGHGGSSDGEIAGAVEALGGEVNAYTSLDRTVYHIRLPSANWEEGLRLLRRLVLQIDFEDESMAREKEVIRQEMAMGMDDPSRRLSRLLWSTAFLLHPYRFPVIGYPEPFSALTREEVEGYHRRWYVPNNMILVAAGDLDPESFFAAAGEIFAGDPRRDYPAVALPPEPAQTAPRAASETMDVANTRLALGFHVPGIHHPDLYALDVLAILAGQGRSSRLYRRLREEEGLVLEIGASAYTPFYPGLFTVSAACEPSREEAAVEGIIEVLDGFRREEVSGEELAKARRLAVMDYLRALASVEGRASDLGSNFLYTGSADFSRFYLRGISLVTAADIRRVAREYLNEANLTRVSIRPGSGGEAPSAAPSVPAPEIVPGRLSNGLVLLTREDFSLPLVAVRIVFRGGVLAETEETNGAGELVSRLLLKGTARRSGAEIAAAVEDYGGALGTFSARNSCGLWLTVSPDRLAPSLELLGEILREASFSGEELERERAALLAQIRSETDRPAGLARRLLLGALFPGSSFRFSPAGTEESVAALDREGLLAFRDRIYTAGNGVLAIFGAVSAAEAAESAEQHLGTLAPGERLVPPESPARPPAVREARGVKRGSEQEAVLLGFPGPEISHPDRYPLEVLAEYFSGLNSPLFLKVRAREGLVYSVGAFQVLGLLPGGFVFYAETAPGEGRKVADLVREEIRRVREVGIDAGELGVLQNKLIGQHLFAQEENAALAFTASLDELYGLGSGSYRDYPDRIREVTPEKLKEVAKKYLLDEDCALVTVGPREAGEGIN